MTIPAGSAIQCPQETTSRLIRLRRGKDKMMALELRRDEAHPKGGRLLVYSTDSRPDFTSHWIKVHLDDSWRLVGAQLSSAVHGIADLVPGVGLINHHRWESDEEARGAFDIERRAFVSVLLDGHASPESTRLLWEELLDLLEDEKIKSLLLEAKKIPET